MIRSIVVAGIEVREDDAIRVSAPGRSPVPYPAVEGVVATVSADSHFKLWPTGDHEAAEGGKVWFKVGDVAGVEVRGRGLGWPDGGDA